MALSGVASFRGYVVASLLMTTAVISHAVYAKRFFYRAVVYLSSSKFAILAVGNMGLVSFLLAWRVLQAIFLGPLRFREVERLHLRARDAIIECCFALTIFREEFNARFLALVTFLLLVKSLHWLCKDRIEFLEEQPLTPRSGHLRLVCMMAVLFAIDFRLVTACLLHTVRASGATMFVLFVFEFTVLLIDLVSNIIRYILHVIDLYMDSRWDGKGLYSFYNELLADLCQLTVYVAFFGYVQFFYTFPLHICRDLYLTFTKFQKRCADFMRYRRVVATMNELFADATEEELAEGDRTCIICREEMRAAKKLNCGHMFHVRCLQSWLKRQLSCPTCRSAVDVSESAPRAGAAPAGGAAEGAAAAGQQAAAGVANNAAPANNGANNGLPPWAAAAGQGPPGPVNGLRRPPPAPGGRPADGGALGVVNAWWQTLMAAIAPQNVQQQQRPMPQLGPRYMQLQNHYGVVRVHRHAPRPGAPPVHAQPGPVPHMPPQHAPGHPPPHAHAHPPHAPAHPQNAHGQGPVPPPNAPQAQGRPPLSPGTAHQHPTGHHHPPHHHHNPHHHHHHHHHQHHRVHAHAVRNNPHDVTLMQPPVHPGHTAHPAYPLHQLYQHYPQAVLQRRIVVGGAAPSRDSSQNGNTSSGAAPQDPGSSAAEGAPPFLPVDVMYRASIDRILRLQEALAVTGSQLDGMQSTVASLREELREALLAATAPPADPSPEQSPATGSADLTHAPVASSVPDAGSEMRRRSEVDGAGASMDESREGTAAPLANAELEDEVESSMSGADQLRQRRLQFLERNASRGSNASAPEVSSRAENEGQ